MLKTDGTINTAVADAQLKLLQIVNNHLVTKTLFTADNSIIGPVLTKSGKSLVFNGGSITDSSGSVAIDAQKRNITKASGVVFHLIDRVLIPN
jgi:uncharacterized surface protein with fasciclin (FAS1) repeats